MHQGTVAVVDPSTAPGGFDVDRLRSLVEARKGLLGLFLRRLIEVPLGLDRPAGGRSALRSKSPDPPCRRPGPGWPSRNSVRWSEICWPTSRAGTTPVGGVVHRGPRRLGAVALFTKMHHCLADGVRGAHLYEVLYDLEPGAPFDRPDTPALQGERIPAGWEMALRALPRLASTPLRAGLHFWLSRPVRQRGDGSTRVPENGQQSRGRFPGAADLAQPMHHPTSWIRLLLGASLRGEGHQECPLRDSERRCARHLRRRVTSLPGRSRRASQQAADRPDTRCSACRRRR